MDADTKEAVEALRDFREFVLSNATQWRIGAGKAKQTLNAWEH